MQTIILGSGVPFPDPERAGPSTLVRTSAGDLLFDCGRAVLMRAAAVGASAAALRALFLTHLHSDHITDLNDVMTTRWIMSFQPNPLPVFGPAGTAGLSRRRRPCSSRTSATAWSTTTISPGRRRPTSPKARGVDCSTTVRYASPPPPPTMHRCGRPSGYRVDDGGASVVIAGDTVPCEGLDELCAGADMLVHTVIRRDLLEPLNIPRLNDVFDYHSTVEDAARTASAGRCGHLGPHPPRPVTGAGGGAGMDGAGAAPISTARSSSPATSSPSTSAPSRTAAARRSDRLLKRRWRPIVPADRSPDTISLPRGARATAASLKFPRPSGIPMMVRQRRMPSTTCAMAIQSPDQHEPDHVGDRRRRPGVGLAHDRTTEGPEHERGQAEAGDAERDGDDQQAQDEPGHGVADGQPQAGEHEPQDIEQSSHAFPSDYPCRCRCRRRRPREAEPSRSSRRLSWSRSSSGVSAASSSAHDSSRSANAGLRASTGPCR